MSGLGLVQFYGPRARRKYPCGETPPEWEVGRDNERHTLDVGAIDKLRKK